MLEDPVSADSEVFTAFPSTAAVADQNRPAARLAVSLASRLVGARRCSLLLPTEARDILFVAASAGISDHISDQVRVRLGEPVAGVVAATGRPATANGRAVRPGNHLRGYLTGSFISVPVPLENQMCGVLNVADPQNSDGFGEEDLPILESLVRQISTSLTYLELCRRAQSLEKTVYQLRRQIVQVQEAERQRIARDLHDEAGHALTAAILRLDVEMAQRSGDAPALETLQSAREELVECAKSLHEIAFNLRPRILEDFGLHAAIRSLARYTSGVSGLDVVVEITGDEWALQELEELAILRVVQEALTNSRKHAHASRVSIGLHYDAEYVAFHIEDDGIGKGHEFVPSPPSGARISMGIAGMRERIELLGGRFWIGRGPLGGTLVSAMLPR